MKLLLPAALALLAAGCLDQQQHYSINPDGSGKVAVRMVFAPFSFNVGDGKERTPAEQAQDAARQEIEKAQGVEAWGDVSCVHRPDGKFEFKGTAYFKDLGALKLHNNGFSGFPGTLTLAKSPAGVFTLEARPEKDKHEAPENPPKLSDEEVKNLLAEGKAEYQQSKAFLAGMVADLKVRAVFAFAGDVATAACFKKGDARTVQLDLAGGAILKAMDEIYKDDAVLERQLRAFGTLKSSPAPDDVLFEKIYGEKGPPRATAAAGAAPLFDWAKEVAAAKAKQAELNKALGVIPPPPPASAGGALKSVEVVGMRIVRKVDSKRGIRPLNTMNEGLTFAILAELPGAVLSVKEGALTRAVSDTGEDLLPKRDWDRAVHFPSLTEDKAGVGFDVTFKVPAAGARGLKEISGTLTYLVGTKTKDVDLGFADLVQGAKGKELGAEIGDFSDQPFDKSQVIELKLTASRESVAGVEFFDAGGRKLDAKPAGSMWGGRSVTLSYSLKGKFPAQGRIVAKVWEDLQAHQVPFKIENVDLLGRPLK